MPEGAGGLPVRIMGTESGGAASEDHLGEVGGHLTTITVAFTRPADTTAYAAKDVVTDGSSGVQTYTGAARVSGGSGYVTKAQLLTDQSANVARFRLHVYNTSAPTGISDNAANTVLYANAAKYVGFIDFPACTTETGASAAQALAADVRLAFVTSGNANLFGVLETLDAFTPANAQQFTVKLTVDQN